MSHKVALGDMSINFEEAGHWSLRWVHAHIHYPAEYYSLEHPNVYWSSSENSPQQMYNFLIAFKQLSKEITVFLT